jgi:uncharacterized protein (TIGR03790 family)
MGISRLIVACVALLAAPTVALAGGGPANVVVLFNADDPDAEAVALYYADARSLPAGHTCAVDGVATDARTISFADYQATIHAALDGCLAELPQPEEIDYLVLVRGLPYRVDIADGYSTSLSAMLQVHHAASIADGSELAGQPQAFGEFHYASIENPAYIEGHCWAGDLAIENPYAGWYATACSIVRTETQATSFRRADAGEASGYDFAGNLFVVTRLDGFDHDDAVDLVDRGAAADGSFPDAEILCMEGADDARGARDPECELASRHLALAGWNATYLTPHDTALASRELAGYFSGAADLTGAIAGNSYVPGAITCNLTSLGAVPDNFFCNEDGTVCPASESQTSIARFVRAGATGAHGAVAEPLNNTFPAAGTLIYYAFGYSLGESYLLNQQFLYWQNIVLGDPLTTPYAERPRVELGAAEVPLGDVLEVTASHPDGVAEIRLYVEGVRVATGEGEQLDWPVQGGVGDTLAVLAVAVAENVEVDLIGWEADVQLPRPDVQGWVAGELTVGEPAAGDDDDSAEGVDDDDDSSPSEGGGGCECSSVAAFAGAGVGGPSWLWLVAAGCALRRRRAHAGVRAGYARRTCEPRRRWLPWRRGETGGGDRPRGT